MIGKKQSKVTPQRPGTVLALYEHYVFNYLISLCIDNIIIFITIEIKKLTPNEVK